MSKWEALNNEFDSLIASLTDADWQNWAKNKKKAAEKNQQVLDQKARYQASKIALEQQQIKLEKELNSECKKSFSENLTPTVNNHVITMTFDFSTKKHIAERATVNHTPPVAA